MTSPLEQCPLPPPLDVNESDPATLWAEIWRLRHDSEGPGEYPTWKDAAIDERIKRVKAERAAAEAALAAQPEPVAWVQLGMRNGHTYVRMHYEGHLYPPPPDVQRNLNLVPLYAAPVAAPVAQPPEPDMRHPKIQRLIGAKARCEIELGLVEQLVEDPNFDATSMDMEYWGPLHDRLKSALEAAPVAQPLTEQAQKYASQNPLGGPAKVFDACADAIRAGDPIEQAMANFGLAWAPKEQA